MTDLSSLTNELILNVDSVNILAMCNTPLLSDDEEKKLFTRLAKVRGEIEDLKSLNGQSTPKDKSRLKRLTRERKKLTDKAIKANTRLVVSITKRHVNKGVNLADLNQEGVIGLIKAVEKFKPELGYQFSTYATWWIRQAVTRAIADQGRTVRVPVHMTEKIKKLYDTDRDLQQKSGRKSTTLELAKEMDMEESKVVDLIKISQHPESLETAISDEKDSGDLYGFVEDSDAVSPESAASLSLLAETLDDVLDTLDPREKRILELRYGLRDGVPHTLEEVGQKFGVTRERIRQIEAAALKKLRHPRRARPLKDFLEEA